MTKIKNAPDTKDLKPQDYTDYSSWIEYWESKKDGLRDLLRPNNETYKYKCSKCGCLFTWGEFNGAHVEKVNSTDEKLYIYPLCEHCNKERKEDPFEGYASLLLEMPQKKK